MKVMAEEKKYIAENGKTLTAYQYREGDESGICKKHNKPFISQVNGHKIYLSKGEYIFVMSQEMKINVLMPELFEKYTKRLD